MNAPLNLSDFETLAREKLDPAAYGYYASGANDEITLRDNRAAYERLRLHPRVLRCAGRPDLQTTLFGQTHPFPLLIAPMGYMQYAHPDGEMALARAAAARGITLILSTVATFSLEAVATTNASRFFQLYMFNRDSAAELVERAEAAGYSAIVLTVDTPRVGRRETDLRGGAPRLASQIDVPNVSQTRAFKAWQAQTGGSILHYVKYEQRWQPTWADVAWLRALTRLPILLKGILRPDDAARAVGEGADGIIVSNHGGRQLDTVPATIDALPGITAAVDGQIPLLLDGGIRRGTDMVKALALGAAAVLLGRPALYGLAVAGEAGVGQVLDLLRDEFEMALLLCGCNTVADIAPDLIFE